MEKILAHAAKESWTEWGRGVIFSLASNCCDVSMERGRGRGLGDGLGLVGSRGVLSILDPAGHLLCAS